eukprot:6586845-Lingulodinium_polyedra.AAC.1
MVARGVAARFGPAWPRRASWAAARRARQRAARGLLIRKSWVEKARVSQLKEELAAERLAAA